MQIESWLIVSIQVRLAGCP